MDKHYNRTKYAPMAKIRNHVYIGFYPEHEVGGLLKIGETEQEMKNVLKVSNPTQRKILRYCYM